MLHILPSALPPALLALLSVLIPLSAAALSPTDCLVPLRPAPITDAGLLAEYDAEIREEYTTYFDEAQAFFRCIEKVRVFVTEDVNQAILAYGALEAGSPDWPWRWPPCPTPNNTFTKERPMSRLSTVVSASLLSLAATVLQPTPAAAYPVDCAILLCLAGGWPASVECAQARAVFIARITPWPVEPPLQIWNCPMRASVGTTGRAINRLFDIGVSANPPLHNENWILTQGLALPATGQADIDISDPAFDVVRSIRVFEITYRQRRNKVGVCRVSSTVYAGTYGEQGDYQRLRSSLKTVPAASDLNIPAACRNYTHRSVYVEWRDVEGISGHEEVHY